MPELTLIHLGIGAMHFRDTSDDCDNQSEIVMKGTCDEHESWLDLPKLNILVVDYDWNEDDPVPSSFSFVHYSTLESTCIPTA